MKTFGQKLKSLRISTGLTLQQTARMLNVSHVSYLRWEQDKTEPSIESIKKLCLIFDVTSDEIFGIETQEQRKQVHINNSFNNNKGEINNKF